MRASPHSRPTLRKNCEARSSMCGSLPPRASPQTVDVRRHAGPRADTSETNGGRHRLQPVELGRSTTVPSAQAFAGGSAYRVQSQDDASFGARPLVHPDRGAAAGIVDTDAALRFSRSSAFRAAVPPRSAQRMIDAQGERTDAARDAHDSVLAAVSDEMVPAASTEQFGRGPTRARTYWCADDILITTLEHTLTSAERSLVALGEHQRLRDTGMFFEYATVREFGATGRAPHRAHRQVVHQRHRHRGGRPFGRDLHLPPRGLGRAVAGRAGGRLTTYRARRQGPRATSRASFARRNSAGGWPRESSAKRTEPSSSTTR